MHLFDCKEWAVVEFALPHTGALLGQMMLEIWFDNSISVENLHSSI
jgi:hypothetical protein